MGVLLSLMCIFYIQVAKGFYLAEYLGRNAQDCVARLTELHSYAGRIVTSS